MQVSLYFERTETRISGVTISQSEGCLKLSRSCSVPAIQQTTASSLVKWAFLSRCAVGGELLEFLLFGLLLDRPHFIYNIFPRSSFDDIQVTGNGGPNGSRRSSTVIPNGHVFPVPHLPALEIPKSSVSPQHRPS